MLFLPLLLLSHPLGLLAAPAPLARLLTIVEGNRVASSIPNPGSVRSISAAVQKRDTWSHRKRAGSASTPTAVGAANATADSCAAPAAVQAAAGAETITINATFGQTVSLGGGDILTDVFYPPSANGIFEIEFQNPDARTLVVTENKTPAPPPTGFIAIEPSSFIVSLAGGVEGLTLQKVDYFFDVTNAAVAAANIAQSQVGKLSANGCQFVIDAALGELEFEADENELTLTVADMNGEWGIFVPDPAVSGGAEEVAAEAAGEEILLDGAFGVATAVSGGNVKTDILYPGGASGEFEVEYNGTAANAITVTQNTNPADPPAGFLFVDPTTFQVATDAATDPSTDFVKIDYFYSEAVNGLVDVKQAVIGKLDPATNTFITAGLGEFEIELEENEWTLTVNDLNGEWAILIPQAALL